MLMALLSGAGCQQGLRLIDEADVAGLEAGLEQCLLQQGELQQQIVDHREHLAAIGQQVGHGPALRQQLEDLALQVAVVQTELARDCPEPELLLRPQPAEDKLLVGEVEDVLFDHQGLILRARIDTGASTSSLDARDIQNFQRDGDNWVRFSVPNPDSGEPIVIERPRARRVRIIQAAADEPERRPVVELRVTLGDSSQVAEFTLSDRSNLEFPVLIGRNILRDLMVVDVSKRDAAPLSSRAREAAQVQREADDPAADVEPGGDEPNGDGNDA